MIHFMELAHHYMDIKTTIPIQDPMKRPGIL